MLENNEKIKQDRDLDKMRLSSQTIIIFLQDTITR